MISVHSASAPDELRAAMEDLVAPLRRRGIEVVLGVAVLAPAEGADLLVERAAVAILDAVAARADVSLVAIGLVERRGAIRLTVAHDRRGGATRELAHPRTPISGRRVWSLRRALPSMRARYSALAR